MIIEISVAVIAVAFLALVIYLIAVFKSVRELLGQMNQTIIHMRAQVDDLGSEAKKVIEQTHSIGSDLTKKMEAFNPMFKALENVGEILETKSTTLKHKSFVEQPVENTAGVFAKITKPSTEEFNKLAALLELVGVGIRLWQQLKKRR